MTHTFEVRLSLTSQQIESYYIGSASSVMAKTIDGKSIQFPASALRQIVTQKGAVGTYLITTDENYKFLSIVPKLA